MKATTAFFFLFFTLIITVAGCNNPPTDAKSELKKLEGDWVWQKSTGGVAGITMTPETEGYTEVLNYSHSGIFTQYIDGVMRIWGGFSLHYDNDNEGHKADFIIMYVFTSDHVPTNHRARFAGRGTLILQDDCNDCFTHVYTRK